MGAAPEVSEKPPVKTRKVQKNFQAGILLKQYNYVEPAFVDHTGLLYGVWGEWLWGSALGNGRANGDIVFGNIAYEGSKCDNVSCEPLSSSTLDVISKVSTRLEYNILPGVGVFAGLGGRYLYDKGADTSHYRRTGMWAFIPVGGFVTINTAIGQLLFDLQYEHIVYGTMQSKLSDVSSIYEDITHSQSGSGLALSAGLQTDEYSVTLFSEQWNLDRSNTVETNSGFYTEPANYSTVTGLKLGYKF